jgi:anti-sigma regulatory factor (Ser/Thr protein kinase)
MTTPPLSLSLQGDASALQEAQQEVVRFVKAQLGEAEAEAMEMVAAELLENAVKHGQPDPRGIELLVEGEVRFIEVVSSVRQADLEPLEERVRWLSAQGDPQQAWMRALSEVFQRGAFGLGLARIASEGGCRISLRMVSPGRLAVRAYRER